MKAKRGQIEFDYTTSDGELVFVDATVYFDSSGDTIVESVALTIDDGEEKEFENLDKVDRVAIEKRACNEAEPQDEVYDEYQELEFE